MVKALLFDLDGTLVDSIPLWIRANLHTLEDWNVPMDAQTFLTKIYQQGFHHHGILEQCSVVTERAGQFYEERNAYFATLLPQKIEWLGGAGKVLQECAAQVPLGLMTGTTRQCIEAMDGRLHLSDIFREIVTYDDTGLKMKPDPYGLMLLTAKLSLDPASCVYIGDQPVDMQAARAAGMKSCLIPTKSTQEGAIEFADIVLPSIEAVPILLKEEAIATARK